MISATARRWAEGDLLSLATHGMMRRCGVAKRREVRRDALVAATRRYRTDVWGAPHEPRRRARLNGRSVDARPDAGERLQDRRLQHPKSAPTARLSSGADSLCDSLSADDIEHACEKSCAGTTPGMFAKDSRRCRRRRRRG